jgi:hypothetical protein
MSDLTDKIQFITISNNNNVMNFWDKDMKHIPTMSHSYTPIGNTIGNNVYPYIVNPKGAFASTIMLTTKDGPLMSWG